VTGPYGADINPLPVRCGVCGHGGIAHLRIPGEGSRICWDCPNGVCQPYAPGAAAGHGALDEDEIDRLIGRAQRMLIDWHRDHNPR
jgi:hypothetical protein